MAEVVPTTSANVTTVAPLNVASVNAAPVAAVSQKVLNQVRDGKIQLEIGGPVVFGIIMLGIAYLVTAAVGINTFKRCPAIESRKKYQNIHDFLGYTLAIALTIPCTLILLKMAKNEGGILTVVYGIMGLAAAAMTVDMANQCKDTTKKSTREFTYVALVMWIICLLIGFYLTNKKYNVAGKMAAGAKSAASGASQAASGAAAGAKSAAASAKGLLGKMKRT